MTMTTALVIVCLTMLIGSVVYVVLARKSPEGGRSDRTPTSVYAVTGGAMSLLIAFTMSGVYSDYGQASQGAEQEADAVYSMNRAASLMAPEIRDPLRDQLVCYGEEVIKDEWPLMEKGKSAVAPQVRATLDRMDALIADHVDDVGLGASPWETANAARLAAHQQRRLVASNDVPPLLWVLLIVGSLITIISLFVYADRSKPGWGHVLVIVGPLFIASAALVVIAFFDHPYADTPGGVRPVAMETMLDILADDPIPGMPTPRCPHPT